MRRRAIVRAGRALSALIAVVATSARPLPAADVTAPAAAARVRVTTDDGSIVGRLVSIRDTELTLDRGSGEPVVIPRSRVLGLELSRRPSRKVHGAVLGLLAGLTVGALLAATGTGGGGAASCRLPPPGVPPPPCDDTVSVSAVSPWLLAAPVGGTLLGLAVAPGEEWRAVAPGELAVRVGPTAGGGVALRVTLGF
jgi:hypothetical protein